MLRTRRRTGTQTSRRLLSLLPLAGCLILGTVAGGHARAGEDSLTLRYYKPELSTADGAAELYRRLDRAARHYCADPGRKSLTRLVEERRCHRFVLERAVEKIDNTRLSSIHAERRGTEPARG